MLRRISSSWGASSLLTGALLAAALFAPAAVMAQAPLPTGGCSQEAACANGAKLSQASLKLDSSGCETCFRQPGCATKTTWDLEKTADGAIDPAVDPVDEMFSFTVKVTEKDTKTYLEGDGWLWITNGGQQSAVLENISLSLEKWTSRCRNSATVTCGIGPSGSNWQVLSSAVQIEDTNAACSAPTPRAPSCYGITYATPGATLELFDPYNNSLVALSGNAPVHPTCDNDGDTIRDEDPWEQVDNDNDCARGEDPSEQLDDDHDGLLNEDPADGRDNDGDGVEGDPGDVSGLFGGCDDGIDNDLDGLLDCADDQCAPSCDEDGPEPQVDNDGDGRVDEDPEETQLDNDGDGEFDEDSSCMDAHVWYLKYSFDITGMGLLEGDGVVPSADDYRLNMMVTFSGAGGRGGSGASCSLDFDCSGTVVNADKDPRCNVNRNENNNVRTVQQRLQFDMPACVREGAAVHLTDAGATSTDGCLELTQVTTLDEEISSVGAGTVTEFQVGGNATCGYICPGPAIENFQTYLNTLEGADGVVNMSLIYPVEGGASYFVTTVFNSVPSPGIDGVYQGWCIEDDITIGQNTTYCAQLVSSYNGTEANSLVEQPWNLDLVNWIMNQGLVYTPAVDALAPDAGNNGLGEGLGDYTYGDVQRAIWELIDDPPFSTSGLGTWNQNRVNEIKAMAMDPANGGDGFVPDCGQEAAVILRPINCSVAGATTQQVTIAQVTLINVPGVCPGTVCEPCEDEVTNTAELEVVPPGDSELILTASATANTNPVTCLGDPPEPAMIVGDFCGYTQGGWGGALPACGAESANPVCLLEKWFTTVYPGGVGVKIGDQAGPNGGAGGFTARWTTRVAVTNYLPAGGAANKLTADVTNGSTSAGVLGGQLLAATINRDFDAAGYRCPTCGTNPWGVGSFGSLVMTDCVVAELRGKTVNQLIDIANTAVATGGLPNGVTYAELNNALDYVNRNFDNCTANLGCLTLP